MTNRELLLTAMPMVSLTRRQWDAVRELLLRTEEGTELHAALSAMAGNQARLEVIDNYLDYMADTMEAEVRDVSLELRMA